VNQIIIPGGDTNLTSNFEYRYHVAGPVTVAAFGDLGFDFITRSSQLRINGDQLTALNTATFGCPILASGSCVGAAPLSFSPDLTTIAGTNFRPRVSTGVELQVILPIVNAPFRLYYAYNPLRLDTTVNSPTLITRGMFPAGGAGDFTYHQALQAFEPGYVLREPRKTFRFTVATTF
jgi:outer membrane protein insertion porin family